MTEHTTAASLAMSSPPSPPPLTRKRGAQKITKMALMQKYENKAIHSFKGYLDGKENNPDLEEDFLKAVKKSPSAHTVDLGITLAVEAGWHKALEELVTVDLSTYKSIKTDSSERHPLQDQILGTLSLPPAGGGQGRGVYANAALLYAIVSKKVDAVRVLAKHMNFNIDDLSGRPLLHYVYLLDEQDVREQMLDIVIPKLKPSMTNLFAVSKSGDLESTRRLVEKLEPENRHYAVLAATEAMLNGHDHIAKWIIETPGLIDWEFDVGTLANAAARSNSLNMVEHLSVHSPIFSLHQFGYIAASNLWAFLQRVRRPELFVKFVPSHPEGFSLSTHDDAQ